MNRVEFMRQLESLLQNISPAEREEAIQYYNDYFDDAGPENEQEVIEALGTPFKVAENIKKDLYSNAAYGEGAFQQQNTNRAVTPYNSMAENNTGSNGYYGDAYGEHAAGAYTTAVNKATDGKNGKNGGLSTGMIVLIVILCVLASPILLGVISGIFGGLVGIIAAWFSLIIGFGAVALALFAVFVVLVIVAILCMFADPLVGVALLGGSMVCGGLGIVFLMLTVALAGIVTPAVFRGIAGLVRKVFGKKQPAY